MYLLNVIVRANERQGRLDESKMRSELTGDRKTSPETSEALRESVMVTDWVRKPRSINGSRLHGRP